MSDFATKRMQWLYSNGQLTRFGTQVAFDATARTFSLVLAALLRYDGSVSFTAPLWSSGGLVRLVSGGSGE